MQKGCYGKAISTTFSECVCPCVSVCVALVTQHAMRTACPRLQCFFLHYLLNDKISFKKTDIDPKMFLISSTTFV